MKINFYLDKCNLLAEVNHSIQIKRKRFGLNLQIDPKFWDDKRKRVKNDKRAKYAQTTNELLDKFEAVAKDYYNISLKESEPLTAENLEAYLNNNFFGDNKRTSKTSLTRYIPLYIKWKEENGYAKGTVQKFRSLYDFITEYMEFYKIREIDMRSIDAKFFEHLRQYFFIERPDKKNIRNRKHNTFAKLVSNIQQILNKALKDEIITSAKYNNYSFNEVVPDKIVLTDDDIEKLLNCDTLHKKDAIIRDMFVIYCDISLRYSDGQRLEKEKHFFEFNGKWFINLMPAKTVKYNKRTTIPLKTRTLELLEKYNFRIKKYSNPYLNRKIKSICKQAGIDYMVQYSNNIRGQNIETITEKYKLITVHSSRAYFITSCFLNGVTSDVVCKITGLSHNTLKHYDKTTSLDMAKIISSHPLFE